MENAPAVNLDLATKLRDREYRKKFFWAESSAWIAKQLIKLRKLRGLNQTDLAQLAGTGQPAISRVERADYGNWNFKTLRKLAEAMDARIRVIIEPAEDVLKEYETAVAAKPPVHIIQIPHHAALFSFTGSVVTATTSLRDLVSRAENLALLSPDQHVALAHRTQSPVKTDTEANFGWTELFDIDQASFVQSSGLLINYNADTPETMSAQLPPHAIQPSQATEYVVH